MPKNQWDPPIQGYPTIGQLAEAELGQSMPKYAILSSPADILFETHR